MDYRFEWQEVCRAVGGHSAAPPPSSSRHDQAGNFWGTQSGNFQVVSEVVLTYPKYVWMSEKMCRLETRARWKLNWGVLCLSRHPLVVNSPLLRVLPMQHAACSRLCCTFLLYHPLPLRTQLLSSGPILDVRPCAVCPTGAKSSSFPSFPTHSCIAQNLSLPEKVREGPSDDGAVTDGIDKSFYDLH